MRFRLFAPRAVPHVRKSLDYLEEANLAWVEHQAAAEHHAALAAMYAERIARIELEIKNGHDLRAVPARPSLEAARDEAERPKTESVLVYPSRVSRT